MVAPPRRGVIVPDRGAEISAGSTSLVTRKKCSRSRVKTKILGHKIKNKIKTSGFEIEILYKISMFEIKIKIKIGSLKIKIENKIFTCQAQDSKLCDHTATSTISLLVNTLKFKDCMLSDAKVKKHTTL